MKTTGIDCDPMHHMQMPPINSYPLQVVTLRDQIAMAALSGMFPLDQESDVTREEYAVEAYRMADAMLKARGE